MIPIFDDNPTQRVPWVTFTLITLNLAIFAYELWLSPGELSALIDTRAFVAADFFGDPASIRQLANIVSASFLHGGWAHVLGNMLYLWIFGNNIEDALGHWRFLLFYVIGGGVATICQAGVDPTSTIPLIGASGSVAAVLGAYAVLYPRARVTTLVPIFFYLELAAIPAVFVIGFWFVLQLAQGLGGIATMAGGVAWWAHVGGFVFGIIAVLPVMTMRKIGTARRPKPRRSSRSRRAQ